MFVVLLLLARLSAVTAISKLACLSPRMERIDWWSGIKLGVSGATSATQIGKLIDPAHSMAYFSSDSDGWSWDHVPEDAEGVSNSSSSLYHTTMQLPYMGGQPSDGYIVYNDQWCQCPPDRKCFTKKLEDGSVCPTFDPIFLEENPDEHGCHCNSIDSPQTREKGYWTPEDKEGKVYGHAKGFIVFNENGGIWVTHSVPGFPYSEKVFEDAGWVWPKTKFAQHFHCVTLAPSEIEAVAAGLTRSYVLPQEHSHFVPENLRELYPIASSMDVDLGVPYPSLNGTGVVRSMTTGGVKLTLLSKEGTPDEEKQTNLWEDVVAPAMESDLLVETWCRGPNRGKDFTLAKSLKKNNVTTFDENACV
ncbi:hypothetical protein TrRE_jg1065 [Triparma retinervis]|uniref:Uncharacterized protein n=1 Tax=Triparma retinervis TaxID=2557542 RepID=A0A9W7DNW9_9STRA|nr:hypothetical protein TrRE_jg1065 [Triparma retinervis]